MIAQSGVWESQYYAVPRMYMTLLGILPYRDTAKTLKFALTFVFTIGIIVPEILYVKLKSIDIDDILDCTPTIGMTLFFTIKLITIKRSHKKIKKCVKMVEEDWLSLKTDVEKNILRDYTQYGIFLLVIVNFYFLQPFLLSLFDDDMLNMTDISVIKLSKLPYRLSYGETLNQYYTLIMIQCYLAGFTYTFISTASDSLLNILIQHACGMFAIIGYKLENIGKDNDDNFSFTSAKIDDDDYKIALNCLRRHLNVIRFANDIESMYTHLMFITLYMIVLIGSVNGFQIIKNFKNPRIIVTPVALYTAHIIHAFLLNWQGQCLLDYNDFPYESICRGKWYYTSRRCRKIFLLIMRRVTSPCRLTAYKLVAFSIENFGMVMKTSLSYFMLLRSLE